MTGRLKLEIWKGPAMSALGHKRTICDAKAVPALAPKANLGGANEMSAFCQWQDVGGRGRIVRSVSEGDF
jgi:hypothetical protein